jgi:D-sedoheptulose 7-phosphate isomerase
MAEHCDHVLKAPASDTQRIQEIHIAIGHALCELVEAELFGDESKRS